MHLAVICTATHLLIKSSVHPLICSSNHLYSHSFAHQIICTATHLLIKSSVHPFICSSNHLYSHSFAHQIICTATHLLIKSSVQPLICSTNLYTTQTGVTKAMMCLSCLWDGAYKRNLLYDRKSSPCSGSKFHLAI